MEQATLFPEDKYFVEVNKNPNPCVRLYGFGPKDKKCKHCALLIVFGKSKRYYKCALRLNTHGAATDHRAHWDACGKFEEDT